MLFVRKYEMEAKMKKEIIIEIIILAIIFLVNGICQNYTTKSVEKIIERLNKVEELGETINNNEQTNQPKEETNENNDEESKLQSNRKNDEQTSNEQKEKLANEIKKLKEEWQEINYKMSYYIEHDELEKVNSAIVKLESSMKIEQYSDAIPELENCKYILEHIRDKQAIRAINFF